MFRLVLLLKCFRICDEDICSLLIFFCKSLMAQGSEFPLRKPPGFHYDFFLLGITTFIAGLIGLPAPNGLIPQAPIHTKSLLVTGPSPSQSQNASGSRSRSSESNHANSTTGENSESIIHRDFVDPPPAGPFPPAASYITTVHEVPIAVVEQRISNLAQGSLCLVLLTGPFLHVLNLIPRGVLAGLL